jgi:hypothetical protein
LKTLPFKHVDSFAHRLDIVQYHEVGYQMVAGNHFVLRVPKVLLDHAIGVEVYPLNELIELFAFTRGCVNRSSELDFTDVLQQKLCTNHPVQFSICIEQ